MAALQPDQIERMFVTMTDDIDAHDETVLTAEYALGLLTAAEEKAFEDLLAVDPDLRDQYALWAENFTSLTDDLAPVAPPAAIERRIKEALFGQDIPAVEPKPSWAARLGLLGPVLAGIAGAVVVLFALDQIGFLRDDVDPSFVAQVVSADASFVVVAEFNPDALTLDMDRQAGGPRPDRVLEVWLIAGEDAPVSLGIWPKGQVQATLEIPQAIAAQMDGGMLAISDEPQGGSPTGTPSGDVLGIGQIMMVL